MTWQDKLTINEHTYQYMNLNTIADDYQINLTTLPYSLRILLESIARNMGEDITKEDVRSLIHWQAKEPTGVFCRHPTVPRLGIAPDPAAVVPLSM